MAWGGVYRHRPTDRHDRWRWFVPSYAAAQQTIGLNQVTETDTSQAIARVKTRTVGQVTETDTSQAITPVKARTVGQNTETDTSQSVSRIKTRTVGQNTETDTSQSIHDVEAIGQVAETDTSQAVVRVKARTAGQVTETDTSQAIARVKTRTVGQVTETDVAQPIVRGIALANDADAGTLGATVSTGDVGSGDQWDSVSITAGNDLVYDSTYSYWTDAMAVKASSPAGANASMKWTGTKINNGSPALYGRGYYYIEPGGIGGSARAISFLNASANFIGAAVIHSDGVVKLVNSAGTTIATGTVPYTIDGWFRLEAFVRPDTVSTGQITARLYLDPEAAIGDYDEQLSVTNADLGTAIPEQLRFGLSSSGSTLWMDEFAGSTSAWLGPVGEGATILGKVTEDDSANAIVPTGGDKIVALEPVGETDTCGGVGIIIVPVGAKKYVFEGSIVDGAGFQNTVIKDASRGILWIGSDVGGVNRSNDHGRTWRARNTGLYLDEHQRVASIYQSRSVPTTLYMMTTSQRFQGGQNRFWRSIDDGESWSLLSSTPSGTGVEAGGDNHPRQTGKLILESPSTPTTIVVGTLNGIYRSTNGGSSWTQRAISGRYVTGLAQDPNNSQIVYATVDGGTSPGVYRVTNLFAGTPVTATQISATFTDPQECVAVNESGVTMLYVAAGSFGVRKWNNNTQAWTDLTPADMNTGTSDWASIDAVRISSNTYILVGARNPVSDESETAWNECLFRSLNSGSTWDVPTLSANINNTVTDASGPQWWLGASRPSFKLGKDTYDSSCVVIDPLDPDMAYSAGRSGLWWTENFTAGTPEWYPCVDGMGATIERDVFVSPANNEHVAMGDVDWSLNTTADGGVTIIGQDLPYDASPGSYETCWRMFITAAGTIWCALGEGDTNTGGKLEKSTDPFSGSPTWSHQHGTGYPTSVRSIGVIVGVNGSSQEVVLVWADTLGIYRRVNNGTWTQEYSSTVLSTNRRMEFAWDTTSQYIWAYHGDIGLLRSDDYGASWTMIWTKLSATKRTGYLVKHDGENTLYLSVADGLYKITNAHDGTIDGPSGTISQTQIAPGSGVSDPGAIAWRGSTNELYVHDIPSSTLASRLHIYDGSTFRMVSGNDYSGQVLFALGMYVDTDGDVYISTDGNGTIKGTPVYDKFITAASETDLAQPITRVKTRAVGQNTETDLAQAITRIKVKALGQNTETDLAQAITAKKSRTVGQVVETDLAQSITATKLRTVGQVSETDLAQSLTRAKVRSLGQNTETDLAQAITTVGSIIVGQVTETDLAQAISAKKVKVIGQVSETDTSFTIIKVKSFTIGQVSETDTAQPITLNVPDVVVVGQALEIDAASTMVLSFVEVPEGYGWDGPGRRFRRASTSTRRIGRRRG